MAKIKVCTHCGFTWGEFLEKGVLGCTHCYNKFEKELEPILVVRHSASAHFPASKVPEERLHASKFEALALLREQLSDAVRKENFKQAHNIKRELNRLMDEGPDLSQPPI